MPTVTTATGLRWLIVILVILVGLASLIISEVAALPHLLTWLIIALAVAIAPW